MCFNPSPVRRVPSPNRYMAVARFCFCKNNKRTIDRIFKAQDVKRKRKASLARYLRGAILMYGEAKRNLEVIGGERDRQLQQLWAETKICDILPWEDVEREAEKLLESTRVQGTRRTVAPAKEKMMTEQ